MRALPTVLVAALLLAGCATPAPSGPSGEYDVGLAQLEFRADAVDDSGERTIALNVFYPAEGSVDGADPFPMPFNAGLDFSLDLPPVDGEHPLVLFSHGRGSNGLQYAWFAQELASHGYVVAAINHYRANTYDTSIVYLSNRLWQRPRDLSLALDFLLADDEWGPRIDADRVGIAGHSQGGFTSLWVTGAQVNPDGFLAFQQGIRRNLAIPEHIRDELPLDAAPSQSVADPRITAAFAMAPGILQAFGMDAAGLAKDTTPTYVLVGARDTQAPPADNAEFAAANIPGARLKVFGGDADHEIFTNLCNDDGRNEFPEACIDAPGVDRAAIHRETVELALAFFGEHLR